MQDDCISVRLGLPELKVLEQKELNNRFEIKVVYRRSEAECPRCGKMAVKIQDSRLQTKQDRAVRDKPVYLTLVKRRFRCIWCQKVFTEPDDVFGQRRRSTRRLRDFLGVEGLHQTVRRLAHREGVGEGLVRRCVNDAVKTILADEDVNVTPEYLGIDEFSVKKRHHYHTTVCDLKGKKIMTVLGGKGRKNLEEYLGKLNKPEAVKAVAMDMHEPFRHAVQWSLPEARVVVDKFHLVWHVNQALDRTRSHLQGGRWASKKRDLFESRYTLLKAAENLSNRERKILIEVFRAYPGIKEAWQLKERFRSWYRLTDRSKAEQELRDMEVTINGGAFPEFKRLTPIINDWREEILNYFDFRITNSFVEGKNNRIKTIKRMAYGYRNMENFNLRILATNLKA